MAFTVSLVDAIKLFGAIAPHAAKDEFAPVIRGALLTTHNGDPVVVATDRYAIAVGKFTPVENVAYDAEVKIPAEAVEWLAKFTTKSLRNTVECHVVRFTPADEDGDVLVEVVDTVSGKTVRSQAFYHPAARSNYPPVLDLVDRFTPASAEGEDTFTLGQGILANLVATVRKAGKDANLTFQLGKGGTPEKPGPVRWNVQGGDVSVYGLAQPRSR